MPRPKQSLETSSHRVDIPLDVATAIRLFGANIIGMREACYNSKKLIDHYAEAELILVRQRNILRAEMAGQLFEDNARMRKSSSQLHRKFQTMEDEVKKSGNTLSFAVRQAVCSEAVDLEKELLFLTTLKTPAVRSGIIASLLDDLASAHQLGSPDSESLLFIPTLSTDLVRRTKEFPTNFKHMKRVHSLFTSYTAVHFHWSPTSQKQNVQLEPQKAIHMRRKK